jgi:hypothetical protein
LLLRGFGQVVKAVAGLVEIRIGLVKRCLVGVGVDLKQPSSRTPTAAVVEQTTRMLRSTAELTRPRQLSSSRKLLQSVLLRQRKKRLAQRHQEEKF